MGYLKVVLGGTFHICDVITCNNGKSKEGVAVVRWIVVIKVHGRNWGLGPAVVWSVVSVGGGIVSR